MKCPYDCGTDIATPGESHGCRNKLRAQRDAERAKLAKLARTVDSSEPWDRVVARAALYDEMKSQLAEEKRQRDLNLRAFNQADKFLHEARAHLAERDAEVGRLREALTSARSKQNKNFERSGRE
jgi:hypothetical protein